MTDLIKSQGVSVTYVQPDPIIVQQTPIPPTPPTDPKWVEIPLEVCDYRQVRRQRQAGDVLVGQHALDRHVLGVDRHHRPAEAGAEQVACQHRAHRAGLRAGADQRHRLRVEQVIEVADGHRGDAGTESAVDASAGRRAAA